MNHILMVDGNNFAVQLFFQYKASMELKARKDAAIEAKTGVKQPVKEDGRREIIYGFLNMLSPLTSGDRTKGVDAGRVIVALDSGTIKDGLYTREGDSWRYGAYDQYKEGRKPNLDMSGRLNSQLHTLPKQLEPFGVRVVSVYGLEGDDIVTHLAKNLPPDTRATIVSRDKDVLSAIGGNIQGFNQGTKELITEGNFAEYMKLAFKASNSFGVKPGEIQLARALMSAGDETDNITGVPGIGPAYAFQLVAALREKGVKMDPVGFDPSVFGLITAGPMVPQAKTVLANKDIVLRNLGLTHENAPKDLIAKIDPEIVKNLPKQPDLAETKAALDKLGFAHFVNQLPKWGKGLRRPELVQTQSTMEL